MSLCKCGCGESVKKGRTFVNKEHQLTWMSNGGASEMNALLPDEVRERGGYTSGQRAAESGRLRETGKLGAAKSREIAEQWRAKHMAGEQPESK
jgi:hypothetical protein